MKLNYDFFKGDGYMSLQQIKIVLDRPSHPGNIGATARAMKNMGLSQLVLVRPKLFPHPEATALSAGAEDILKQASVVDSLSEAVSDCTLVAATSARMRTVSLPQQSLDVATAQLLQETQISKVAILFGCERTGLTNAALDLCQLHLSIPANEDYNSLNLAQAVLLIAYELRRQDRLLKCEHAQSVVVDNVKPDTLSELGNQSQLEGFFQHLESMLQVVGFLDQGNPKFLMRRLRRLFARTRLDKKEINILRGLCRHIIDKVRL